MKKNKSTIIVTAATSRLSEGVIEFFLTQDWNVIGTTRNINKISSLNEKFNNNNFFPYHLKFLENQIENDFSEMNKIFGELNVLLNCASSRPKGKNVEDVSISDMEEIFSSTVNTSFICTKTVMKYRKKFKLRSVINVGSIYGSLAVDHRIYDDHKKQTPLGYSVSKSGLIMMTKYLAAYWGHTGVRINCVSPAGIENNQDEHFRTSYSNKVPMKRFVTKEEVIKTIFFLANEGSSGITGQNLIVDAGMSIW